MSEDFQPLDLGPAANGGWELHTSPLPPPAGLVHLRGIPFLFGADGSSSIIGFPAATDASVRIRVGRTADRLIFAHALLESRLLSGELPGHTVARYKVAYTDGGSLDLPIRERFEVDLVPGRGAQAVLAVSDHGPVLMPRFTGDWIMAGRRLQEVESTPAQHFYLWPWLNPRPDVEVESILVEPAGRRFVLGAITLGVNGEEPFPREPARPVRITLHDEAGTADIGDLEIEVDRGTATRPYPLPDGGPKPYMIGWGEVSLSAASPAYAHVQAVPSATLSVRHASQEVATARWRDIEAGSVTTPRATFEVVDPGRNWVRVTVLDADTGAPVPCRIHFQSPEGIPFAPTGHHPHALGDILAEHLDVGGDVRLGRITYAYIDGHCEGWLPRGRVIVDIARGFEYEPLRTEVTIAPDQRELTLQLRRWIDMNGKGWFSGDTHVHSLSTQGGHFEARGEDLDVVHLLATQVGHAFDSIEELTFEPSVSADGQSIVFASSENRSHAYGHLGLLGLKRVVHPLSTGGPDEGELGGTLEASLAGWADAAHAAGGTVVIAHHNGPASIGSAALVATGRADAYEMVRFSVVGHMDYYRFLNAGYQLPLVGGTDKLAQDQPIGITRTYAKLPGTLAFDAWLEAVRAGRTFLSSGPMLFFTVNGEEAGATVHLEPGSIVSVETTAESIFPISTLQVVVNGKVVAESRNEAGGRRLTLETSIAVTGDIWIAARCGGPTYGPEDPTHLSSESDPVIFAHTSPVYVATEERWNLLDPEAAAYMLSTFDVSLGLIRGVAVTPRPGTVTHHHGEADHLAYLERPYLEARGVIEARLRAARDAAAG